MFPHGLLLRWRGSALHIVLLLFLSSVLAGCCTYRDADEDEGVPPLIGWRCVVVKSMTFEKGDVHLLPGWTTPRGSGSVELEAGTVLRVAHVQYWSGPIDPSGVIVYADVENGKNAGVRVHLGLMSDRGAYEKNHRVALPRADIDELRALGPADDGFFYGLVQRGSISTSVKLPALHPRE